jgi:hypothetical protein
MVPLFAARALPGVRRDRYQQSERPHKAVEVLCFEKLSQALIVKGLFAPRWCNLLRFLNIANKRLRPGKQFAKTKTPARGRWRSGDAGPYYPEHIVDYK